MIYVLAFDPSKISTLYASQNDRPNLNFVKDSNVVGNKMTTNDQKGPFQKVVSFLTEQTLVQKLENIMRLPFLVRKD